MSLQCQLWTSPISHATCAQIMAAYTVEVLCHIHLHGPIAKIKQHPQLLQIAAFRDRAQGLQAGGPLLPPPQGRNPLLVLTFLRGLRPALMLPGYQQNHLKPGYQHNHFKGWGSSTSTACAKCCGTLW